MFSLYRGSAAHIVFNYISTSPIQVFANICYRLYCSC